MLAEHGKVKWLIVVLCALLCTSGALAQSDNVFDPALYEDKLAVWFFALPGEDHTGESILLRAPTGECMLIDGGIPTVSGQINDFLAQLDVTDIDVVLATHMHIDHVGGLSGVMSKHKVKRLYTSPFTDYDISPVNNLKAAAQAQGLALTPLLAGDTFCVGEALVEVLYPFEAPVPVSQAAITGDFLNDSSVVCRVTYKKQTLLLMGDATRAAEAEMLNAYGDSLKADVIKVGHHGSSDASTAAFVNTVNAAESVMCIYAFNDFNVYERYKKVGNRPWVTSIDGTVLYATDGETAAFYSEKIRKGMLK